MKTAKEIVEKARTDPRYARELEQDVEEAAKKGILSPEHRKLVKHFVTDDQELENLLSGNGPVEFGITTVTTTTTYTTAACTTTGTTTTTTGN